MLQESLSSAQCQRSWTRAQSQWMQLCQLPCHPQAQVQRVSWRNGAGFYCQTDNSGTQIVHALRRHGQTIGLSHLTSEQKQDCTRTNEDQTWHAITQKHYFTSHWYTWRQTDVSNHDQHNRGAAILSHLAAMKKFLSSVFPLA